MQNIALQPLEHKARGSLINCCFTYDLQLLVLEIEKRPEHMNNVLAPNLANELKYFVSRYKHGVLQQSYPAFTSTISFHFAQLTSDNQLLLIGGRTEPDTNNAWLYDESGQVLANYYVGDGIEDVWLTKQNKLWVTYFDEGVFGSALSNTGVLQAQLTPTALTIEWEAAGFDIADCYASNTRTDNEFWFYAYTEFFLVQVKQDTAQSFSCPIKGAHYFIFTKQGLIMGPGYDKQHATLLTQVNQGFVKKDDVCFTDEQHQTLTRKNYAFTGRSNALVAYDRQRIYWQLL